MLNIKNRNKYIKYKRRSKVSRGQSIFLPTIIAVIALAQTGTAMAQEDASRLSSNFTRDYVKRFQQTANSDFEIVSNTIVIDAMSGRTIDMDETAATRNSSAATLSMPVDGRVSAAYLVVQGTIEGGASNHPQLGQFLFRGPNFDYVDVPEMHLDVRPMSTYYAGAVGYQAFADVTDLVAAAGAGVYGVGNVHADTRSDYLSAAGWALIVIYESAEAACRQITTIDGLAGFAGPTWYDDWAEWEEDWDHYLYTIPGMDSPSWPSQQVNISVGFVGLGGSDYDIGYWDDHLHFLNQWPGYPHPGDGMSSKFSFFNGTLTDFGRELEGRVPSGMVGPDWRRYERMSPNFDAKKFGVASFGGFESGLNNENGYLWLMAVNDEFQSGFFVYAVDQDPLDCNNNGPRLHNDQLFAAPPFGLDPVLNDNVPSDWVMTSFDSVSEKGLPIRRDAGSNFLTYALFDEPNYLGAPNTDRFSYTMCNPGRTQCLSADIYVAADSHGKTVDEGMSRKGAVSGRAWLDWDGDGLQDNSEPSISQLPVLLYDNNTNQIVRRINTWNDGSYIFTVLPSGSYRVEIGHSCSRSISPTNAGADSLDSDFSSVAQRNGYCYATLPVSISPKQHAYDTDLGLSAGVQGSDPAPVASLYVNLIDENEFSEPFVIPTSDIPLVTTNSNSYEVGQPINVSWTNASTDLHAWIGVFSAGSSNSDYLAFAYTDSAVDGNTTFTTDLEPGSYEVRLFQDIGLIRNATQGFVVGSDVVTESSVTTDKSNYALNEPIRVSWSNGSGDPYSWIGIYRAGTEDRGYLEWTYLNAQRSGSYTFNTTLSAGNYEVRLFQDNGYTRIAARPFTISDTLNPPGSTENLAINGTATQSSTAYNGVASRAIDGNTSGRYGDGSVTHTASNTNAWWQVALPQDSTINEIVIHNRTDCCVSRLSNYTVSVLDRNGITVWNNTYVNAPNPSNKIVLSTTGRTIRISNSGYLSLAEVEVVGQAN